MKSKLLGVAVMAALMAVPAAAQDATATKKKGRRGQQNAATQLLKQLEKADLTDDQVAKVKELGKSFTAKMKAMREDAGITAELVKKRAEAQKSLKDSGKKGKELLAAVNEAAGFSESQAAANKKINTARTAFQKSVIALLTDEQKENLPERLQRAAKSAGGDAKKKKRKKKDE